jgi:hypothetical protein
MNVFPTEAKYVDGASTNATIATVTAQRTTKIRLAIKRKTWPERAPPDAPAFIPLTEFESNFDHVL